jgi:hypothetical protein
VNFNFNPLGKGYIVHTSIRRYEGINPDTVEELIKRVEEGFVPIVSAVTGFIGYHFVVAENGVIASISMFETEAAAEESNKAAASWGKENVAELLPSTPQITAGEARIGKSA